MAVALQEDSHRVEVNQETGVLGYGRYDAWSGRKEHGVG